MQRILEGIRVLDLSRMLPGPFASMMLGDLGAEVIKVEEPSVGDPTRWSPPLIAAQSAAFLQVNRNKGSIALDLKRAEGRQIFLRLAERADVVLDQFRPGVVDRLGVGYSAVSEVNPRIVYCALTGFGQDGPHRDRSGHDLNYLALAGVLGLTTDERGKPVIPGVQVADIAGGMIAAYGIIAALYGREKTGRGQYVDVSMYDVMMAMLAVPAAQHFAGVHLGVGDKYGLSGAYPFYNVYETADGKFMTLGALEPKFWKNFCLKADREDLIARQFDTDERRAQLFEELSALFKSRTQAEWVELMADADACCEPVLAIDEAFDHPQAHARERVYEIEHPIAGKIKQLGFIPKLSGTPGRASRAAPALGEQTDQLLAEIGLSESERDELYKAGIAKRADSGADKPDSPPLRV